MPIWYCLTIWSCPKPTDTNTSHTVYGKHYYRLDNNLMAFHLILYTLLYSRMPKIQLKFIPIICYDDDDYCSWSVHTHYVYIFWARVVNNKWIKSWIQKQEVENFFPESLVGVYITFALNNIIYIVSLTLRIPSKIRTSHIAQRKRVRCAHLTGYD